MLEEIEIKAIQDRFDMRYKRQDECDRDMRDQTNRLHSIDLRLTTIETSQRVNNWLTGLIAGGIVALVIRIFLGG